MMISTDDGTFVFILLFVGFKVETDVGINTSSVPIWIFEMLFWLRVLKVHLFFGKVSTEDSNRCRE